MKMRSVLMLFLGLSQVLHSSPSHSSQTGTVGLEDAKKFAVEHNYEVTALRKTLEEAKAVVGRVRSSYYPKLGVAGGADNQIDSHNSESAVIGYAYGNINVFNGFSDSYRSQIASLEAEKAEVRLNRTEFRVGLDVENIFHLYIFTKGKLDLKNEALTLNNELRKLAKQKRGAGMTGESDVMDFDLRDAILRSDIVLVQQELESARANLRRLLGEEIGAKIEPIGKLQHQHIKGSLMDYIKKMNERSEQVLIAGRNASIASVQSKTWTSKWLPKFDIEAKAGYLPLIERPQQGGASLSLMGIIKLELFSGFDAVWEKREGEAKRLKTEAELKNAILTSVTQMDIAYRKLKVVQERVDLEEKNLDRAEKYYRAVMSEYKRGIKNSIDLKQAAEVLYETKLRRENYKYEFLSDRIELEKSLGASVETEKIHEEES